LNCLVSIGIGVVYVGNSIGIIFHIIVTEEECYGQLLLHSLKHLPHVQSRCLAFHFFFFNCRFWKHTPFNYFFINWNLKRFRA